MSRNEISTDLETTYKTLKYRYISMPKITTLLRRMMGSIPTNLYDLDYMTRLLSIMRDITPDTYEKTLISFVNM